MATRTFLHLIALIALIVAAGTTGRGQESKIWTGVYSSEQAEQGKRLFESNCSTCHRSDLSGDRGPALVGDRFFTSWQSGSLNRLFSKIKETMPPNRGTSSLSEDNFLAIVAYVVLAFALMGLNGGSLYMLVEFAKIDLYMAQFIPMLPLGILSFVATRMIIVRPTQPCIA